LPAFCWISFPSSLIFSLVIILTLSLIQSLLVLLMALELALLFLPSSMTSSSLELITILGPVMIHSPLLIALGFFPSCSLNSSCPSFIFSPLLLLAFQQPFLPLPQV
jgi:hypothetical protein